MWRARICHHCSFVRGGAHGLALGTWPDRRYAQRARAIRNNLRLNNQMTPAEEVAFLREVVAKLEAENSALKARLGEK